MSHIFLCPQMLSLAVIFINVVVAANGSPAYDGGLFSIVLMLLNVIVLVVIVGKDVWYLCMCVYFLRLKQFVKLHSNILHMLTT